MNQYERSSLMVAAVISLTVHATAVFYLEHYDDLFADRPESTVSFMRITLAPARPAAPHAEPERPPEPAIRPEPPPPPPPQKEPAPKPRRARLPEPVIDPLPATIEAPQPAEFIEEQTTASSYAEAPLDKPALEQLTLEQERESYLLRLLAHIDSHKFYPRSARRRGTEGEISVAFYLRKDGSISELRVTGGSKVLREAAKQAVQRALSLPLPPDSMPLQQPIRFAMVYRLDG
jgi:periplasmic protein TonB